MTPNAKKRQSLTGRVLRDSLLFSAVLWCGLAASEHGNWAISYLWGAFLSLISMASLLVAAPRLLSPKAPQAATFILMLLLFMKLPFYGFCLFMATRTPGFSAVALLGGAVLAPAMIAFDAMRTLLPQRQSQAPVQEAVFTDLQNSMQRLQQLKAELLGKRG